MWVMSLLRQDCRARLKTELTKWGLAAVLVSFLASVTGAAFINFIGSVCFTFGSYAAFLEAINLNLDVTLIRDAEILEEKIGPVSHPVPKLIKIKWFAWQSDRLEYWGTFIQFIGACLFNINCFFV